MMNLMLFLLVLMGLKCVQGYREDEDDTKDDTRSLSSWRGSWSIYPAPDTWSLQTKIPMTQGFAKARSVSEPRGKFKVKKKFKKFLLPLLLAYKLKFFTLIPVLIGGLILLTGATGLAGFFFALFAAVMGLKAGSGGHH